MKEQQKNFNEQLGELVIILFLTSLKTKYDLYSSEYQEILQAMSQSDAIDMQRASDDDLIHMKKAMNKDDQDLRSVLVEVGLLDRTDMLNGNEEQPPTELDQCENDYDVDELLKDALTN